LFETCKFGKKKKSDADFSLIILIIGHQVTLLTTLFGVFLGHSLFGETLIDFRFVLDILGAVSELLCAESFFEIIVAGRDGGNN
jgi:hypothetical protein